MAKTFSFPLMMAILLAVTATVATQQFQPGICGPTAGPRGCREGHRHGQSQVRHHLGHRLRRRRRPAARIGKNVDWPRIDSLANYTRTMNWEAKTMKEEFDRKPGSDSGVVEVRHRLGRRPAAAEPAPDLHGQRATTPGTWTDRAAPPVASPPDVAEIYQLELWLNPHGFLKAAQLPGANPKATWRWELGEMGRDGPEVPPEKITRRLDHRQREVPGRRDHQQREHAPADPHLGPESGARRHELRARVHQRQLHRHRQRHQVSDRLALARGMGRQLQQPEHQRRPQRVRRTR